MIGLLLAILARLLPAAAAARAKSASPPAVLQESWRRPLQDNVSIRLV